MSCAIYKDRPEICRVNKMYEKANKKDFPTIFDWHRGNHRFCNQFMDEDGVPVEKRIHYDNFGYPVKH